MSQYEFVKDVQWVGDVKIYRHKITGNHIAVSRAFTSDRGDETMIFAYDLTTDSVSDWTDLYAGYGESHERALANFESEEL